ncbi:MAG: phosphate/phosphite/phosphonate ABC transporter substrate-binding protein [Acidiferrobacterales bacterium]
MTTPRILRRSNLQPRASALVALLLALGVFSYVSLGEGVPATAKASYDLLTGLIESQFPAATAALPDRYVLVAPPSESAANVRDFYIPLARYLSNATGKLIVYEQPPNWRAYHDGILRDSFDLAFDNPQFVSWRIANKDHKALARIASPAVFVVLARRSDRRVRSIDDLVARPVCGQARFDSGTLSLFSRFERPARRPVLISTGDWQSAYETLISGGCDGAVVPLALYKGLGADRALTRVLLKSSATPGQTLTAGPRLSAEDKVKITQALMSPAGQKLAKPLCQRFDATGLVEARGQDYAGLSSMLRNTWGFDI